jgi:hypothetical protein|nr:MAG TPA: hypothetical protein [Caudoviricetes sp.]DAW85469.1 MAG TPA: hypothetical protein [Bacteriophage sp.]
MGSLGDILKEIKNAPRVINNISQSNIRGKSMIRRAKDATFQFPMIIPKSCPIDMATACTRMMDRVYAGYTQIALGNNSTMNMALDSSPTQFLKRFHQNIKFEQAIADLAVPEDEREAYMEKAYNGEYRVFADPDRKFFMLFNAADKKLGMMLESNREGLKPYLSEINMSKQMRDIFESGYEEEYTEAESDETNAEDLTQALLDGKLKQQQLADRRALADIAKNNAAALRGPQLTDGDIKRMNDMTPYAVQIRLSVVNSADEFVQYMDIVVGIKTVLHLVDTDDMISNLEKALQNRSGLFRFLRWTTGEISLVKDLLLNMDDLRFDAANQNAGKSPLFGNLKRMKRRGVGMSGFAMPHGLIPNATLLVTSYEVDHMKNTYGIDMREESVAKKLMEGLDLMTFIICDDGAGTVDILYDGDATFQTYALESIEREVSMNSNKLGREIGRMIAH